ncbi:MAG: tetratricopeptide repeat protein [Myxococcota bacterium]
MSDEQAKDPESAEGGEAAADAANEDKAAKAKGSASASSKPRTSRRKRRSSASNSGGSDDAKAKSESTALAKTSDDDSDDGPERRDLPKWNRARVKRKAPKGEEQDAFQASVRKAGQGILQRPAAVIGLIVVVAGVSAGVYAWMQGQKSTRASATAILSKAVTFEARGQADEQYDEVMGKRTRPLPGPVAQTEDDLRTIVDGALADLEEKAGDTDANEVADLVRAARLMRALEFESAEKAYRGFLQRQPGHRLVFLAREGLAVSLENQERWDDALAELEPMLGGVKEDFYRDQALWHKGRILESAERGDEALAVYQQYAEEFPLDKPSLASDEVRARLEELDPSSVPPLPENPLGGLQGLGGLGGFPQ